MASSSSLIPPSELAGVSTGLPRGCTFAESDWRALATFWYPVAHSVDVTSKPLAVWLLDERVVVYRLPDGTVAAARDICYHRGVPLSLGFVEGNELVANTMGFATIARAAIPASPRIQAARFLCACASTSIQLRKSTA